MKLFRIVELGFVLLMVAVMFISAGSMPQIYDPNSAPATHIADRYIEDAVEETGSPNMVTAVLADYRGYDTLGETTVIFTAGLTTVFLLRATQKAKDKGKKNSKSKEARFS